MKESARYLSAAETAKLMRAALKKAFPAQKFSVRSSTYAGGASITVRYKDGPTKMRVEAITGQFAGGGFDGMIDMKYNVDHWLLPDGSTQAAYSPGTEGSRGTVPSIRTIRPHDDAELVSFGSDYVFVERDISAGFARKAAAQVAAYYGVEAPEIVESKWGGWQFADEAYYSVAARLGDRDTWSSCILRATEDRTIFAPYDPNTSEV